MAITRNFKDVEVAVALSALTLLELCHYEEDLFIEETRTVPSDMSLDDLRERRDYYSTMYIRYSALVEACESCDGRMK